MFEHDIFLRILLTVVFGAILGLESDTREIATKGLHRAKIDEKNRIGGLRTYSFLSLIGGVAGLFFYLDEFIISYLIFSAIILLVITAYVLNVQWRKAFGMTTEIAILITFLLGFLTTSALTPLSINLFILIILAFLLSQKRGIGSLIERIEHTEVNDMLKFGLLALVILPILPNYNYSLEDLLNWISGTKNINLSQDILNIQIINPFKMWFIVVIISGINLGGQILKKVIGSKGIVVTGIIGGLLSSTSTTVALASQSKHDKSETNSQVLAGSALLANAASLPSILILIGVLSSALFNEVVIPFLTMTVIGLTVGGYFVVKNSKNEKFKSPSIKYEPFAISPAIKFVTFVVLLSIIIQFAQLSGNNIVITVITATSGVLGMDAPTIALSNLVVASQISAMLAGIIFLATNMINFTSKAFISKTYGDKKFFKTMAIGLLLTAMGSIAVVI